MPAGYSATPLAKKLGIKADHRIGLIGAPNGFEICAIDEVWSGLRFVYRLKDR